MLRVPVPVRSDLAVPFSSTCLNRSSYGVGTGAMVFILGIATERALADTDAMPTSTIPPTVAAHLPTGLLIDGHWRPSSTGATFTVQDPATEETLFDVADASSEDALAALTAADAAWPAWREVSPRQ